MFWILALASMLGYVIQGTLIAKYSRKIDSMSVGLYRNISLSFTMLPLLFWVPTEAWKQLPQYWEIILLGALLGGLGLSCSLWAVRFLPVGVNAALSSSLRVISITVMSYILFHETLNFKEIGFMGVLLFGVLFLAFQRFEFPHLGKQVWKGLLAMTGFALTNSAWYLASATIAREVDIFLASYIMELAVAVSLLFVVFFRHKVFHHPLQKISWQTFGYIALVSSPTMIGTAAFMWASTMGKLSIISTIGASGILVTTFLSHFLYHEKLTFRHWFAISIIVGAIVGLKWAG